MTHGGAHLGNGESRSSAFVAGGSDFVVRGADLVVGSADLIARGSGFIIRGPDLVVADAGFAVVGLRIRTRLLRDACVSAARVAGCALVLSDGGAAPVLAGSGGGAAPALAASGGVAGSTFTTSGIAAGAAVGTGCDSAGGIRTKTGVTASAEPTEEDAPALSIESFITMTVVPALRAVTVMAARPSKR